MKPPAAAQPPFSMLRLPRARGATATTMASKPVRRVVVCGKFPNPTFDYYFAARLIAPGMPPFEQVDIRDGNMEDLNAEGVFVIIVRYISGKMSRWIARNRERLAGVALFVDDDIAGVVTGADASIAYRYRLFTQALLPLRRLEGLLDELWVSTETLASRLQYANPSILAPAPMADNVALRSREQDRPGLTLAYHATAIHVDEHGFLLPVIRETLAKHPDVRFEVFAEGRSAEMWGSLASNRIEVRKPVSWPSYLAESGQRQIDIMLVPVAPGPVNDCRADTKLIDIARVRAAPLLSDCPAFHGAAGALDDVILPYDRARWTETLERLIASPSERMAAACAAQRLVDAMADRAQEGIPSIMRRAARA